MIDTERRLGFPPPFGAFAAFDAFYVYEYFYRDDGEGGFAAVAFPNPLGWVAFLQPFSQNWL